MANREGRKTVAAELPVELYEKLSWCIGKNNPVTNQPMKRMSDVMRFLLEDAFLQVFNNEWVVEQRKAARAAKTEANKEAKRNALQKRDYKYAEQVSNQIEQALKKGSQP